MAFGIAAPAGAQADLIAQLQAQINALMAQLAALQGGSASASTAFTMNLTVGSTGSEVVALQQVLVAGGYLTMPAGVAMGTFGPLTRAAVAAWQAANGVTPAAGYWGPISRARYAAVAGSTPTVPGTTVPGAGITTPGVEGTITVSVAAAPANGTKLYEGDEMRKVLGIELEAKTSDIRIERVKIDLDCSTCSPSGDTNFYRRIADRIYIMDGSTVLGSADLNSSTVVEDGSDYFITVAGLNLVVPKGTEKVITVALDAYASWDSDYDNDSWTLGIPAEGVRGVDGAGVNQYGPTTAFTRSFTSNADQAEDATVTVSLNTNTPKAADVICTSGSDEDECDELEILRADFKADDDDVIITDLVVDMAFSGAATTTTGYLYDGSTLVGSDSIDTDSHSGFTFDDIDWTVPDGTTRTLTVKVDVIDAATSATTFAADIDTADVTAENSEGDTADASGSAAGNTLTVREVGPEFSLISRSILPGSTPEQANISTSTAQASFTLRITAVGGDLYLGTGASSTPIVSNAGNDGTSDGQSFVIYRGGTALSTNLSASTTGIEIPTSNTTASGSNTRVLAEGASIDVPITFLFHGRDATSAFVTTGSYAVGLEKINWVSSGGLQHSTFMSGLSEWRTSTVALP